MPDTRATPTIEIRPAQRDVLIDGAPMVLGARAFDVLAYLSTHRGRVVSKQELLEQVWGGLTVEEGNLTVQISTLRKVLGTRAISTVPGVGYKLTVSAAPAPAPSGPALPGKPSLAVLPFANLTGAPDKDYLVDGIVTDLIAGLSRISGIFVIAATSSFKYKGRAVDLADVGRELGVRYVLEGSIQQGGDTLRITTQLVEAETGRTIWNERFTGAAKDVFDLQDEISEKTVAAIEPSLLFEESRRARAKPTESLQAYDLTLRAAPLALRVATLEDFHTIVDLCDQAIALDPDYAYAKALKVCAYTMATAARWRTYDQGREVLPLARGLLDAHQTDPLVLTFAGHCVAYLGGEPESGNRAIQRAKAMNPNSILVLVSSGWCNGYVGAYAAAIADFERAYRINPLDPNLGHCRSGHGYMLLALGRIDEAVAILEEALADAPEFGSTVQALIVGYEMAGRHAEAKAMARAMLRKVPGASVSIYRANTPFTDTAFEDRYAAALLAAGFPA